MVYLRTVPLLERGKKNAIYMASKAALEIEKLK